MDIVRFKGGLGNQMFQYAFMLALKKQGRDVKANLGYYKNNPNKMQFVLDRVFTNLEIEYVDDDLFNILNERWKEVKNADSKILEKYLENPKEWFFCVEKEDSLFDERVNLARDCAYVGYWQTEKYFKEIAHILKEKFVFINLEDSLWKLSTELAKGYTSVHIRRGDYMLCEQYQGICTKEYYRNAMSYIERTTGGTNYAFFSDDITWVKENFQHNNAIIISKEMFNKYEDWYDLFLMSRCENNVIANSSFSWWAAWLNNNSQKIVVAPKAWLRGKQTPDIWCKEWVKI